MNTRQAMDRLKAMGTAQTRKTYGRHGVTGEMFGVRYGDLEQLVREIKVDHELALSLWETGNHDARVLAAKIIDPSKLRAIHFNVWIKDVDNHVVAHELGGIARRCEAGRKVMKRWMASKKEWPAATGWGAMAGWLGEAENVTKMDAKRLLSEIEKRIHSSPNRVKYSMNNALIAIGSFVGGMEATAIKVAERIGQVEVDHGLTSCQTPLAAPYIRKAAAHRRANEAKAASQERAIRKARASEKAASKAKPRPSRGKAAGR